MKKILFIVLLIAVLGGGGAAAGFFYAGTIPTNGEAAVDPNQPQLVVKEGVELSGQSKSKKGGFDESKYQATYYTIEQPFTSNLSDSNSFAQMSLAIATYYDERVIENIQTHETAIRSTVLLKIAEQETAVVGTVQGKEALQKLLTKAINQVLEKKTGFGGVHSVYFSGLVIQ